MTSRLVEDTHAAQLRELFLNAGLECTRSPIEEQQDIPEEEDVFEEIVELEDEVLPEVKEEQKPVSEEEQLEEKPEVFPTPSLRRVLSSTFRAALEDNTIHVLPETFKTKIDPEIIPHIMTTPKRNYIDALANITGCSEYPRSLAEYWFLDTLANLLRRAQADGFDKATQALLIHWFCEWMKEMQHFDAATRERMIARFQENMLAAATFVGENSRIPTPAEISVHYKEQKDDQSDVISKSSKSTLKMSPSSSAAMYECALVDLSRIIHYIFDLFSTDFQYDLIRSIFTFPPDYIHVDYPYQIQHPKRMYAPLKAKVQKQQKKEKPALLLKSERSLKKLNKEVDDYDLLMELKARDEKEIEEQLERDREDWHVRNSILPLYMAVTDALYDQYWPPTPPEPEEEPNPKKKPKKKEGKKSTSTK